VVTKRHIYIRQNGRARGVVIYREPLNIFCFGWVLIYLLASATLGLVDDPQVCPWSMLMSLSHRISLLWATLATPY